MEPCLISLIVSGVSTARQRLQQRDAMQESLSVISWRNVWNHCSHHLAQGTIDLQTASAYGLAAFWSVAGAIRHVMQAAGLLGQPLRHLASQCSMKLAAAGLGSAGRITLLMAQCGYAIGMASFYVICLLAAIAALAAELTMLSLAAAFLLLMMAAPFQIARLFGRTLCRLFPSLQTLVSRVAPVFWLSSDWRKHKPSWLARPELILHWQAWTQSRLVLSRMVTSKLKLMVEALVAVEQDQCAICLETVPKRQMVCVEPCSHSYCHTCVATHFQTRLETNRSDMLRCPVPGCISHFDVMQCHTALRSHKSVSRYNLTSDCMLMCSISSNTSLKSAVMRTVATAL